MEFELYNENSSIIKVIGVGGGGSNAVNHMFRQGIKGVEFIVCNTDAQALEMSPVPIKVQLGMSLTEGRGAGSQPDVRKNAAIENIEEVKKILFDNTKMVFITAGMGGGTGTGAAPIIAQAARELGILTVGIVTVPFTFEGKKRKLQADHGVEELKKQVDTLLIICNDKLREMYGNLQLSHAFGHADDILTIAAKGIAEIITQVGYINVDFEDVKTVMTNSGRAIMGSANANGPDRAIKAVKEALSSPLLNDDNIKGARYILMNIASGDQEVTMDEIGSITDFIQDEAGLTADIIWGNCQDENLGDKISVTIVATGFKTKAEQGKEFEQEKKIVSVLNPNKETRILDQQDTKKAETFEASNEETNPSTEPVLIKNQEKQVEESSFSNEISFEFEVGGADEQPDVFSKEDESDLKIQKTVFPVGDRVEDLQEEERRARERMMRLKSMNYRINGSNINDLEQVPAYVRKEIKLQNVPHSSEEHLSRSTVSKEENKRPSIKDGNGYLHDQVD